MQSNKLIVLVAFMVVAVGCLKQEEPLQQEEVLLDISPEVLEQPVSVPYELIVELGSGIDPAALQHIAENANGDLRAAVVRVQAQVVRLVISIVEVGQLPTLVLTISGPLVMFSLICLEALLTLWTAMDLTDGDLATAVQVTGSVNTFEIGTYILTYTVQDAQGNVYGQPICLQTQ